MNNTKLGILFIITADVPHKNSNTVIFAANSEK
jgi:hypothetical protein